MFKNVTMRKKNTYGFKYDYKVLNFFSSKPCTYTVSMQICTVLLHRPSFYMCVCTASPASVCVPLTYVAACCFSALARVAAQLPAVWLTGFCRWLLNSHRGSPNASYPPSDLTALSSSTAARKTPALFSQGWIFTFPFHSLTYYLRL